jgi:LacI family transcriptional regulator
VLRQKGYSLVLASSEEDPDLERIEIDNLLARQMDALLVASSLPSPAYFRRIELHRVPYVLIDRCFEGHAAHFVGVDDRAAGYLATRHLIARGYRRLAHIRGAGTSAAAGRMAGFRDAMADGGLTVDEQLVVAAGSADDTGETAGYASMCRLLHCRPAPDAVFAFNDPIALGAMRAILDAGLRIPQDVGLAGCGNANVADLLRVPMTTVDQYSGEIGERAAQMALSLIEKNGDPSGSDQILLKPALIERDSSAGPG